MVRSPHTYTISPFRAQADASQIVRDSEEVDTVFFLADDTGAIYFAGRAWEAEFGWGVRALEGLQISSLVHPQDKDVITLAAGLPDGPALTFRARLRAEDGRYVPCELSYHPFGNDFLVTVLPLAQLEGQNEDEGLARSNYFSTQSSGVEYPIYDVETCLPEQQGSVREASGTLLARLDDVLNDVWPL